MSLIDEINATSRGVLSSLISPGQRCAILDIPATANWGDHAIWMGERAALASIGARVVYEIDDVLFDPDAMRNRLGPDGVVLLHGGGSLGDIYPPRQAFREMALAAIRDLPVIQLPQSIHFRDDDRGSAFSRLARDHPQFTLLSRDLRSQQYAQERLGMDSQLCPDLAFAMGELGRLGHADYDVLWLDRKGPEAVDRPDILIPPTVLHTDWRPALKKGVGGWLDLVPGAVDIKLRALRRRTPVLGKPVDLARGRLLPHLGPAKVRAARRFLSQGRTVVTDRLHGHVLCLLMNIPHVLLDNRIGKLGDFYRTWTSPSEIASFAESEQQALDIALATANSPAQRQP
jgi:pyruvyl transferase EpsO